MKFFEIYKKQCAEYNTFVLQGVSGSGKTQQLKYLAKQLLAEEKIPIYLDYNNHLFFTDDDNHSAVYKAICHNYFGKDAPGDDNNLLQLLCNKANCFVFMLDSFDSLDDTKAKKTLSYLSEALKKNKNNRLILSVTQAPKVLFHAEDMKALWCRLEPLAEQTVTELLEANHIHVPEQKYYEIIETLRLPKFLTMVLEKPSLIAHGESRAALLNHYFSSEKLSDDTRIFLEMLAFKSCSFIDLNAQLKNYLSLTYEEQQKKLNHLRSQCAEAVAAGILTACADKSENCFHFSEVYRNFFFVKSLVKRFEFQRYSEVIEALNTTLSEDILSMLYFFLVKEDKDAKSSEFYTLFDEIRRLNNSEESFSPAVSNIVKIFSYHPNQLNEFNLSGLDLRACSFIGIQAQNADFSNALVADECFIPIEPTTPSLFAISPNGNYFLSGDAHRVNLRFAKLPYCSNSFFAGENEIFERIEAKENFIFLIGSSGCKKITVENTCIVGTTNAPDDEEIPGRVENNSENALQNNIKAFADSRKWTCCFINQQNYVLFKSMSSYRLYHFMPEEITFISRHDFKQHLQIKEIIQSDNKHIEFLFPAENRPLRSIAFDTAQKKISVRQYPALRGKMFSVPTEKDRERMLLYFDIEKIPGLLKHRLLHQFEFVSEHSEIDCRKNAANASEVQYEKLPDYHILHENIHPRFKLQNQIWRLMHGKLYREKEVPLSEFSSDKWQLLSFHEIQNIHDGTIIDFSDKLNPYEITVLYNINVKEVNGEDILCLGRNEYVIHHDGTLEDRASYELAYEENYEHLIDSFPWEETLQKIQHYVFKNPNSDKGQLQRFIYDCVFDAFVKFEIDEALFLQSRLIFTKYLFHLFDVNPILAGTACASQMLFEDEKSDSINANIASGLKNWCYPCENGVIYYDGEYGVYVTKEAEKREYKRFAYADLGVFYQICRGNVHYNVYPKSGMNNHFLLLDIKHSFEENKRAAHIVPIYDLYLYHANIENIKGLSSGNTIDIINKSLKIPFFRSI